MRVILLKDVNNLGKTGDEKEVTRGYARNYLIPAKLAVIATDETAAEMLKQKKKQLESVQKEEEAKKILAERIKGQSFEFKTKEKKGKLFGSIGKKEIAKKIGMGINEEMVEIEENIKQTGKYEISINLGKGIKTKINIDIRGE